MKPNVGQTDRLIRFVVGLILLLVGLFALSGVLQFILILLGAVLIATGVLRFCPLYLPFKMNTLKK